MWPKSGQEFTTSAPARGAPLLQGNFHHRPKPVSSPPQPLRIQPAFQPLPVIPATAVKKLCQKIDYRNCKMHLALYIQSLPIISFLCTLVEYELLAYSITRAKWNLSGEDFLNSQIVLKSKNNFRMKKENIVLDNLI